MREALPESEALSNFLRSSFEKRKQRKSTDERKTREQKMPNKRIETSPIKKRQIQQRLRGSVRKQRSLEEESVDSSAPGGMHRGTDSVSVSNKSDFTPAGMGVPMDKFLLDLIKDTRGKFTHRRAPA